MRTLFKYWDYFIKTLQSMCDASARTHTRQALTLAFVLKQPSNGTNKEYDSSLPMIKSSSVIRIAGWCEEYPHNTSTANISVIHKLALCDKVTLSTWTYTNFKEKVAKVWKLCRWLLQVCKRRVWLRSGLEVFEGGTIIHAMEVVSFYILLT